LFKKTSADFDEGGAGGILMNHLGCDGSMRVVFDAGDAKLEDDEDKVDEEEEEVEEHMKVDISKLKS
jgi:condensin complex subunit 2